ncbi:MAG TPA: hypothetical protein DDZ80_25375 [Cyanobacteria bacterium UBA8803]|nr:hypothetical protein [Cyanobacteria bacterium UBA9273]HBL61626.1 hypothetical protein [Cyanobacteria bacterium UBA8803]
MNTESSLIPFALFTGEPLALPISSRLLSLVPSDLSKGKKKPFDFNSLVSISESQGNDDATVVTNKIDYHPAETAYITASGFALGETVEFQVLHLDAGADGEFGTSDDQTVVTSGEGHEPWQVQDGSALDLDGVVNGAVKTSWYVNPDDSLNATFLLTATGQSSGEQASYIFTDSGLLDLTNPTVQSNGSLPDTSGQTVLFAWTSYPGGSGATTSFLRLKAGQGSTIERGYNTNGTQQFDTQKQGTQAILLSALPTITIDNTTYYEFRIDLNESNSNPQIDLTKLQVFQSNVANLTGYNSTTGQLGGLNPVINLNGTVKLDASLNPGGGVGDVLVYLPGSAFTGNPANTYLYTYAEFQNAESGYEEFSYATTTALGPLADLSLTQTVSNTNLFVGNSATFTLTLNNAGVANATGVKVKDLLPSGFSFTSATPSVGTYNSSTGIWDVGSIASGSNATLTLTGTVLNAASAAAYTNVAEVIAANQFDPDSAVNNGDPTEDDYTSVLAPVVKLDLTKQFTNVTQVVDGDGNGVPEQFVALPGDNVTFQIKVTNNGVANATNVVIKDDLTKVLPVGLTLQSLGLDVGGTNLDLSGGGDGNAQTIEVLFNNIAAGATKTITVNAQVSNDYITPINFSGQLGTSNSNTGDLNTALPEYYDTIFNGTLYLNYNVQKAVNQGEANFGFLNITSDAEVVSANGQTLAPGSIKASGRLDVSTYKIAGTLNNGQQFKVFSIENLTNPSSNPVSFFFNPDPEGGSSGYPTYNQSEFLPNGQTGFSAFLGVWDKISDPAYLADLAAWMNMSADGNLSSTADEQALINALYDFITDGVYRRDNYAGGYFMFDNGSATETLNFEGGEFSPISPTSGAGSVNILVTDAGAAVTDSNGNSLGSFVDLQAALDSFNFANPTGVNVTIQDSSGDGQVITRLQELGSYDFAGKWSIQTITINSNVSGVTFTSTNGAAAVDFSFSNLVVSGTTPTFTLQGNNAVDTIIGTRFADTIQGLNGADILSGGDGNDTIDGGLGGDRITGGRGNDSLTGGSSIDTFVFGANFGSDTITDLNSQDLIDLSALSLSSSALDSNNNGAIDANDNLADIIGGNLVLNLTSLNGGTITMTGVASVNMSAVIL